MLFISSIFAPLPFGVEPSKVQIIVVIQYIVTILPFGSERSPEKKTFAPKLYK